MNGGKQQVGYTIIEVMIVLAASSLIFMIAANFISGKQARTSFKAGVNEMSSRIDDMAAQVTLGHYTDRAFGCTSVGSNPGRPQINAASASARSGVNSGCVFLGKFMHLNPAGTPGIKYNVYSLAGNRLATVLSESRPPRTLDEANPTIIRQGSVDLTAYQAVPQSLDINKVRVDDTDIGLPQGVGFGFVQGIGTPTTDGKNYKTGSQTVSMVKSTLNILSGTDQVTMAPIRKATVCMTDGTRWAVITVSLAGSVPVFYSSKPATVCT